MTNRMALAVPLSQFMVAPMESMIGGLTSHAASQLLTGAVEAQQVAAWQESLSWLQTAARSLAIARPSSTNWTVVLEYAIPRRGSRVDALLIADDRLFVLEFKSTNVDLAAKRQAEDYGIELRDFHAASPDVAIYPIACGAQATHTANELHSLAGVGLCSTAPPEELGDLLEELAGDGPELARAALTAQTWLAAPYHPTPTIIEAARALYSGHSVRELSTSEASTEHLARTQTAVGRVVDDTFTRKRHAICFITGVPGAGKTLAGLNVVHDLEGARTATFLSGNGPLVKVLQAVLSGDLRAREGVSKGEAERRASTMVNNVHRWIDEYVDHNPEAVPHESVVVFDEAQRAWSREHSKRKFGRDISEPEAILEVMSRRPSAVLVGLIGGGQEINTGEAGLSEWGRALVGRFKHWDVVLSPEVTSGQVEAGTTLFPDSRAVDPTRVQADPALHLKVSQRSYRAERLSEWVEHVLAGRPREASQLLEQLPHYPIVMTRSLPAARAWTAERTRGLRRCGLLASSGARRLRQDGISVTERVDPVHWYLKPADDVRSSSFLELPMTEFGVQGLELDWACVAWGGDLTRAKNDWLIRSFRGTRWQAVKKPDRQAYAINRYRVLLTRAREGMVIWIPSGSDDDKTRQPAAYDSVASYLTSCGVPAL